MAGDTAPEEHFGPYTVYERLGIGGMATVHRALEHAEDGTERIVALKRLIPHLAEDASFIKSFVREAKLASMLDHINIVQIYELGRVGTEYFISMEYIDGRDVRRILRHARKVTGPPPIYVTVGLMLQLCDALEYAHNRLDEDGHPLGLVHRDISPSNLIVTSQGTLKIIDFGIAKAQSSQLRTQTGRVKGKLAYMAPEAVSGTRELDARSDVWACGVILHELITARPLFASKNEYQTLLRVQRGDIARPSTLNAECPPELDAIVFHALAREPDNRYSSAADLRESLLAVKKQYGLSTTFSDIASWVEWAFGNAAPDQFGGDTALTSHSRIHHKTPRPPRNTEEDEAVEVVWGSGNNESDNGPLVLEEVPDVSDKRARRDTHDDHPSLDDIPTPLPSHGVLPSIYETKPGPGSGPAPGLQPTRPVVPMPARSKIPTGIQPVSKPPSGPQPVQPRTKTGPQEPPRTKRGTAPGVTAPPPTTSRTTTKNPASTAVGMSAMTDRLPAQHAPDDGNEEQLEAPTILQRAESRAETSLRADSIGETVLRPGSLADVMTNPLAAPISEEEIFRQEAAEVLAGVSAQIESMSTSSSMRSFKDEVTTNPEVRQLPIPAVPVVRFSKSMPPPNSNSTPFDPARMADAMTRPGYSGAPVGSVGAMAPAAARPKRATVTPPPVAIIAPDTSNKKVLLLALGGVVLAGGTAAIVALSMGGSKTAPTTTTENAAAAGSADGAGSDNATGSAAAAGAPALPPAPTMGKVKFQLEPTDAQIVIEGKPVHMGSPWVTELAAGNHQIEIHRTGYKSWLTTLELSPTETAMLRVVLEPVTAASDAALIISTTPEGLDVYIDGVLFGQKTPIKTSMNVGQHKLSIKQAGVEVWQQNVNAEASSDYEFHPSFNDDKKREHAPHPTPAPPKRVEKADTGSDAMPTEVTPPRSGSASGTGSGSAAPGAGSGSAATTPKTETPKTETPKTEAPKTDAPKVEPSKTEPPKTEPPKTEPPKAGSGSPLDKPATSPPPAGQTLK